MPEMPEILAKAVAAQASDILIVPNEPPIVRIDGRIQAAKKDGMCSMDQALAQLIFANAIDIDTAWEWSSDINTLQSLITNLGAIAAG